MTKKKKKAKMSDEEIKKVSIRNLAILGGVVVIFLVLVALYGGQ